MKLEKYNQRLLAILGTLVLVSFVIIVLVSGTFFVIEIVRDFRRDQRDNTLVAKPTYDSISGALIRKQEISFESPTLIDSALGLYVIPISQLNLKEGEFIQNEVTYGKLRFGERRSKMMVEYRGSYNNIILYNKPLQTKHVVFDKRVSINFFHDYRFKNKRFLLLEGVDQDTNKDNLLNGEDLKSFFIYDISSNELRDYRIESMGLVDFYVTIDGKEVILSYAKDKDENGEIERYLEPVILKSVSLENFEISDFIQADQVKSIQSLID